MFAASGWSVSTAFTPIPIHSSKTQLLEPQQWAMTGSPNEAARSMKR